MADAWRDVVLKTIRETPSKKEGKTGEGYGSWLVARVRPDGNLFGVTLRAGRYYTDAVTGEKRYPKEGLGYYDLMDLKKKSQVLTEEVRGCAACGVTRAQTVWDEAVAALDPKKPPKLPQASAPAEEQKADDDPFA